MAEKLINVEIVTPANTMYSGEAQQVVVPGTVGPFTVLYQHAPIISSLEPGAIRVTDSHGRETVYATDGGFAEVLHNKVTIIVESAQEAREINIDQVMQERQRALDALARAHDRIQIQHAKDELVRVNSKIQIAQKYGQ